MNVAIVAVLLAIMASLGKALFAMASGPQSSRQMANALTVRIVLSVVLFVLLLAGKHLGVLVPHGL